MANWNYYYLQFDSEDTASKILNGFKGCVDAVGQLDTNLSWHVNIATMDDLPEAIKLYIIFPEYPKRVFAASPNEPFKWRDDKGAIKEFDKQNYASAVKPVGVKPPIAKKSVI